MNAGVDALLQCLAGQTKLVTGFIATLEDEAALLLDTTPNDTLDALTARKNDYAQRLAELDRQRIDLLARLGFGADRDGVEAAIFAHPALREPFDELLGLAARASALNAQNGQLIQVFLASNQRALDTLRGLMGENLYDARGRLSRP